MKNESGIRPVELKVLILPDETEKVTKGGIIIADTTKERADMAVTAGTLIDVGSAAFGDWPEDGRPEVGSRVVFAKYAGLVVDGKDGKKYRVANDKDVAAVLQ